MRAFPIFLFLAGMNFAYAQAPERGLQERLNYRPPMIGEKITKENQAWANSEANKQFQGKVDLKIKSDKESTATFDTKDASSETYTTRSFLGVKNPWFGKTVFVTKNDEWSKKTLSDATTTYKVTATETRDFYQSKKETGLKEVQVPVQTASVQGKAQGALDATKKNLSIDEVREILNKNH